MNSLSDLEIPALLRKYGVKPDKRHGQSFLKNHTTAREIVRHAGLTESDVVLEIGGGLGILTRYLAQQAGRVYVVEIDKGLATALRELAGEYPNLTVIEGDALRLPLPAANKVVSNLPYSISSEITFRLLREMDLDCAVLMYQREFAERLMVKPGSPIYSRLSVNFQYSASAVQLMEVEPEEFYPVPAVSSLVVKVLRRSEGPFAKDEAIFHWLVRGIYSYPNKHVRRALAIWFRTLGIDKKMADDVLSLCSSRIPPTAKLRSLDLESLVLLADTILELVTEKRLPRPGESQR